MKVIDIVKTIAGVAASVGSGAVVGNAIKASTPEDATKVGKVLIGIGGFILSNMLSDASATYAENTIDAVAAKIMRTKVEIDVTVEPEPEDSLEPDVVDPIAESPSES